jgi:hypothetical protein
METDVSAESWIAIEEPTLDTGSSVEVRTYVAADSIAAADTIWHTLRGIQSNVVLGRSGEPDKPFQHCVVQSQSVWLPGDLLHTVISSPR